MIILLMMVLLFFAVEAVENPKCISPAYLVDYTSPISGRRTLFCQKKTTRGLVKEGDEIVFSKDMTVIERNRYKHGKKVIKKRTCGW